MNGQTLVSSDHDDQIPDEQPMSASPLTYDLAFRPLPPLGRGMSLRTPECHAHGRVLASQPYRVAHVLVRPGLDIAPHKVEATVSQTGENWCPCRWE